MRVTHCHKPWKCCSVASSLRFNMIVTEARVADALRRGTEKQQTARFMGSFDKNSRPGQTAPVYKKNSSVCLVLGRKEKATRSCSFFAAPIFNRNIFHPLLAYNLCSFGLAADARSVNPFWFRCHLHDMTARRTSMRTTCFWDRDSRHSARAHLVECAARITSRHPQQSPDLCRA